jgi:uncharacterized protein
MSAAADINRLFPIFLKLEELQVLLVGAGKVGLEKLQAIISNAPATTVQVVAAIVSEEVKQFAAGYNNISIEERPFETGDLEEKDLVVIAIDDKEMSRNIRQFAKQKRVLVNVADKPELCDFYLGSIVQKGNLKIAISTNGKSPTIAKRIKETLNDTLPEEIDELLQNMQLIRNKLSGDFAQKVKELNELTKQLATK